MMAELTAAFTSLKAASELAQALMGLHDTAAINAKSFELQREILSAQSSALAAQVAQSALLNRVGELEKELAELKAWDAEKEKYELTELGRGTFAYASKRQTGAPEPKHSLCPNCYQDGRKSILQREKEIGFNELLRCLRCRGAITIG
jgi:hypothetical protein